MMKNIIFALATLMAVFCSCQKGEKYKVDIDFTSMLEEDSVQIDSVVFSMDNQPMGIVKELTDGHAFFEGSVDAPKFGKFMIYFSGEYQGEFYLLAVIEEGNIALSPNVFLSSGTPMNDSVKQMYLDLGRARNEKEACVKRITDFVMAHRDDVSALVVLCNEELFSFLSPKLVSDLLDKCSEDVQNHPCAKELRNLLQKIFLVSEGHPYVDFEAEYEGKVQRLSDYVGKGKYVLVDFWASWCGPCRAEIPNLIRVYKEFGGDRLEVLGVATWDAPEDTKTAIEELGIPYPQIMNAQAAGSDAYNINGIPEIILFGPDGTIMKRGLRGGEIEQAVREVLE